MKLHYQLRTSKNIHQIIPIVIIHGLFGNLSNLGSLAAHVAQNHNIIQIDVRNHGHSPHHPIMTYSLLAQDIVNLLNYLSIRKCIVIGHSMGGKIAMALSILESQYIEKIIILDIAPIKYDIFKYNNIFKAIEYINQFNITNKNDVINIMQKNLIEQNTILFLLKSFHKGLWSFNFQFIKANYVHINNWPLSKIWKGPALFIKGSLSSYINNLNIQSIYNHFPCAYVQIVPNAGHWVYHDNPKYVLNVIDKFLSC